MKELGRNVYLYIFVSLLIIYTVLVFSVPINKTVLLHYHLSVFGLRSIELTYVIPQLIIWGMAYVGFTFLKKYSLSIVTDRDGKQMVKIAAGIGVLAFGGPIVSSISTALGAIAYSHPHFLPSATIINNYLALLMATAAFLLIGWGAAGLSNLVKSKPSYKAIQLLTLIIIFLGTVFCYLVFRSTLPNSLKIGLVSKPQYFLPDWLALTTLVIPYIFVWFNASLAVLNFYGYHQKVKGTIYKKSLFFLASGIGLIGFSYIVLEYLSIVTAKIATLKIAALLGIIYPLLFLVGVGYALIALGAQKLHKIEEI